MSSEAWESAPHTAAQDMLPSRLWLERAFVIALFVLSFAVRWLFADGDFNGDESWYYYLSRGFGREPAVQFERPWFHIANRPLYYALYHLGTYGGLTSFRLLGCVVGSLMPVLAFAAARSFGASFLSAAAAACCLSAQAQQLRYSATAFPDSLAAAIGLGAVWAVAARAPAAACVLSIGCVAAKESFVAVPAIVVLLDLCARREREGRARLALWHYLALGIPVAYIGMLTAIALGNSVRLQGWSEAPFTLHVARNMWLGWELWPLIAWLAWQRQARSLLLWLGLPLFYLLWNRVLGRGLAPWYVVGPAAFASVAAALALDHVYARCSAWATRTQTAAGARWLPRAAVALTLLCLAPVPGYGLRRVHQQWRALGGRFPMPDAATQVQALIAQRQPESVLVVDCFWAYRYSHLRGSKPGIGVWWYDATFTDEILASAKAAALVVTCRDPEHEPIDRLLSEAPFKVLYEDPKYLVSARAPE